MPMPPTAKEAEEDVIYLLLKEWFGDAENADAFRKLFDDPDAGLKQHVLHLVLDLRLDIIEQRMKEVQQQLRQVGNDMERANALLEEYKKTQLIRDALARQLGKGVVR